MIFFHSKLFFSGKFKQNSAGVRKFGRFDDGKLFFKLIDNVVERPVLIYELSAAYELAHLLIFQWNELNKDIFAGGTKEFDDIFCLPVAGNPQVMDQCKGDTAICILTA